MGQKVNPSGFRLGINRTWDSKWYADDKYSEFLENDLKIRKYIEQELKKAGLSKVIIERSSKKIIIAIHAARPGIIIGKKGSDIEKLKKQLSKLTGSEINLNIVETKKPELDAKVVADNIAMQIENRAATKRVMKRAVQSALKLGAQGIRVCVAGRIGGAEIARVEWFKEGRVPLHTLRANIDYAVSTAKTTYGTCGVKVWLYKGEKNSEENKDNNNLKDKNIFLIAACGKVDFDVIDKLSKYFDLKQIFEKSLAVNKDLKIGDTITFDDLEAKKPKGQGISANAFETILGKKLITDKKKWDFLNYNDLA